MPDGPSVEIKITADTSGVDQVTTQAQRLAAELARTGNNIAKIDAQFVATGQRAQEAAKSMASLGTAARQTASVVGDAGRKMESAGKDALKGAAEGARVNSGVIREVIVELHELVQGRFTRMGSSAMVLAERMGSLDTIVTALKGPFGAAALGAAALGVALYEIVSKANAAEAALRGVYNASLLMGGMSAAHSEMGAQAAMTALGSQNVMGSGSIDKYVQAVYSLGDASDSAKQKLVALGPALYIALNKNDKELEKYVGHFNDTSSLKSFIEEQGLATQAQASAVDQAVQAKDTDALRAIALDALTKRLSGATGAIASANAAANRSLADWMVQATPGGAAGVAATDITALLPHRLPETPAGARPQVIQQQIRWLEQYNRTALETAVIEGDIAKMRASGAAPALIKAAQDRLAALKVTETKKAAGPGAPTEPEQLRARMAEAENVAAAHAKNLRDLHQGELQADIGVLGQELNNEKLTAAQRLAVEADLARKKAELMAADLRPGRKGPSAATMRGGGAEARSDYQDFAASEREKIAAAAGSGAQIAAIYQEWAARAKAQFGDTSREFSNVMREMTVTAQREARAQARAIAEATRQAYAQFAAGEREKITASEGSTAQILAIYQEWADRAKALFSEQSAQYQNVVARMTEAANRASDQMQEAFARPLDVAGSSIERSVTGLLTRQTTGRRAEQEAYRGLVSLSVGEIGAGLNKSLTGAVFGAGTKSLGEGLVGLLGIGKPGGLFGTGLGAVAGAGTKAAVGAVTGAATQTPQIAALTANTGVLTTLNAAIVANTAALTASATSGAASAAGGAANLAGNAGGIFSGIGKAAGWVGSLFSFSSGGIMPRLPTYQIHSYAAGGITIPGLAKLHENEMVLPNQVSSFVQRAAAAYAGGGGPGGGPMEFHLHNEGATILDGASFGRWLQANGKDAINNMIKSAFRSNALTPRTL